jgi:hypothetical protein
MTGSPQRIDESEAVARDCLQPLDAIRGGAAEGSGAQATPERRVHLLEPLVAFHQWHVGCGTLMIREERDAAGRKIVVTCPCGAILVHPVRIPSTP